jgi:hypothetical protein
MEKNCGKRNDTATTGIHTMYRNERTTERNYLQSNTVDFIFLNSIEAQKSVYGDIFTSVVPIVDDYHKIVAKYCK